MISFHESLFLKRSKGKNGKAPLYVRVTIGGQRTEFSLNVKLPPEAFDPVSRRANRNAEHPALINKQIENSLYSIKKAFLELQERYGTVTPEQLKAKVQGKDVSNQSLVAYFQRHNQAVEKLAGKDYAPATVKRYETALRHVQAYIAERYKKKDVFLREVDHTFIEDFYAFLRTVRECNNNSSVKYLKNFGKIIRKAVKKGLIEKDPFAGYKFKIEPVKTVFLTEEELNSIRQKRFGIDRLDIIKDLFVFCCYTGLAYTDVSKLTSDNISRDGSGQLWIRTERTKTKIPVNVPLLKPAMAILEQYSDHPKAVSEGKLLPVPSNQKCNAYLKEVADLCGIRKKLTTHTARHTFATGTLNKGVSLESVSKMLGHTNTIMTQHYAKIGEQRISAEMAALEETPEQKVKKPKFVCD